jgi:hypothetical protein
VPDRNHDADLQGVEPLGDAQADGESIADHLHFGGPTIKGTETYGKPFKCPLRQRSRPV